MAMEKKVTYVYEGDVPYQTMDTKIGFRVKEKLFSGKSEFQKIDIYDLFFYGRTLMLDNIVQTTEKDEFIYHEVLCHTPIFAHPDPKNVLVIGGGDGGSLEEVLKHKRVKKAVMVEIDGKVVEMAKKYIPSISKKAYEDERAELVIADAWDYLKKNQGEFDVVILDLSDPSGPAEGVISLPFYRAVKKAMKKDGIVSVQSGSLTIQPGLVKKIYKNLQKVFKYAVVRRTVVPAYQAGEYSFSMASDFNFNNITMDTLKRRFKSSGLDLQYWSPEMHEATTVLPKYIQDELK